MLEIAIVDITAEARTRTIESLSSYISEAVALGEYLPRVSLVPLTPGEVRFHSAPQICVVGSELLRNDPAQFAGIRQAFPGSVIIAQLSGAEQSLASVEHLARLGVDDVIDENITRQEFLRKLVVHSRRRPKKESGILIVVDSGKGGTGVTSIAAALGEALAASGRKTALVDLDTETQDLTRFLGVRPCVSENLSLLLSGERAALADSVEQCAVQVWDDEPLLSCVPPVPLSADSGHAAAGYRGLPAILDTMLGLFECVVVDAANARAAMLSRLYVACDTVILVVNRDPASLHACVSKLARQRHEISANGRFVFVDNLSRAGGVSAALMCSELGQTLDVSAEVLSKSLTRLEFSKAVQCWPASGGTLYSLSNANAKRTVEWLCCVVTGKEPAKNRTGFSELVRNKASHIWCALRGVESPDNRGPAASASEVVTSRRLTHSRKELAAPTSLAIPGPSVSGVAQQHGDFDPFAALNGKLENGSGPATINS